MSVRMGILGSGTVARTLGSGYLDVGHEVILGSRDPSKLADWVEKAGSKARVGTFSDAAHSSEILILAVKGTAAEEALSLAGPENLRDKVILDATNPIADVPPKDGVLSFFTDPEESLMNRLQKRYPGGRFVKAFNSVGAGRMVRPDFDGIKPTMFICGDDEDARKIASGLIEELGWEVCDMGSSAASRTVEALCILWCIPGFRENSWNHALKLLR
jgi:predicted dinucleotide-binding enzyme